MDLEMSLREHRDGKTEGMMRRSPDLGASPIHLPWRERPSKAQPKSLLTQGRALGDS